MSTIEKLYLSIVSGTQDKNTKFRDLQKLLDILGFECRIKGDHFIYSYGNLRENINIQPDSNMAKPYQVSQIRNFLQKYQIRYKEVRTCIRMNVLFTGQTMIMPLL